MRNHPRGLGRGDNDDDDDDEDNEDDNDRIRLTKIESVTCFLSSEQKGSLLWALFNTQCKYLRFFTLKDHMI